MWRPQLEALARFGRSALAPDLPGHGRRRGERFTLGASLAAIDDAVHEVGGRAVVVGMSLGGYLGIAYTARNPDRVAALVAGGCSSTPDHPLTGAWLRAVRLIGRLPDRGSWLNQALVDRALPRQGTRDIAAGGFALDVIADVLTEMRALDPLADLARTKCPVWILNGQWDHFRLGERDFAAACPRAQVVTVRGANHIANLSRPVAFNRALLEVLEHLDPADADRE